MTITTEHQVTVTIEQQITGDDVELFYDLYEQAFGPLRTLAVARQVLHANEFREEMRDPRILKFVSWNGDGVPLGLTTLTNHLETVPWISPEYFAAKYPEHAARGAIYYLGFTLVRDDVVKTNAFAAAVDRLITKMATENAIMCLDICSFNVSLGFADVLERMADAIAPTTVEVLDTQTYYGARFGRPRSERVASES